MRSIGSKLCLLFLAVLLGACCEPCADPMPGDGCTPCPPKVERGKISSMKFEDFFMRQQTGDLLLIDARHLWFFNQGRIPGAITLASGDMMDDRLATLLPKLKQAAAQNRPIVVYCNGFGCKDARTVSRAIAAKGLDVSVYGGGWKAWKKSGLPVESASQDAGDLTPQPAS